MFLCYLSIFLGLLLPHLMMPFGYAFDSQSVSLCNKTSYIMDIAFARQDVSDRFSKGWYQILSGDCTIIPEKMINDGQILIYGRSHPAHQKKGKRFVGTERFCIRNGENFDIKDNKKCHERGFSMTQFQLVSLKDGQKTIDLMNPHNYSSKRARIAGIQRLLQDLEYDIRVIDGILGKTTRRMLSQFQKKKQLDVISQMTQALQMTLLHELQLQNMLQGLHFCNETNYRIWVAIGVKKMSDMITQGWVSISEQSCMQIINHKLKDNEDYFIYAEAVTQGNHVVVIDGVAKIWRGDAFFCTKPTRFLLKNHDTCTEDGLDIRGFMKIETNHQDKWMIHFE